MENKQITVNHQNLQTFVTELFSKAGMPDGDATYSADCMVLTNLWGIDSHGVLRAPIYVRRVRSKAINPNPNIVTRRGGFALEVLDGDDGMGYVVGRAAMNRAIELAGKFSIGAVGVVRSNHFGAAALFARMASEQGMIGIAMANVIPNVVAPGGAKPITGNNPIAIAVPTFAEFPFVLDISLSNVAGGKLLLASKKGEKIPWDWATDREGHPTDDPAEGFKGFLLPVGGHKGLGLSYVVDILSGLITGGVFQHEIKSMYKQSDDPSLTGHFMIAINPLALMSQEELHDRMTQFVQTIHESPMWDKNQEMLLPGELEHRKSRERKHQGIPLPPALFEELTALGKELNVSTQLSAL
ncbi:MAG: Ldh family oxidoreductase [Chloroflexi bacterium]|nr:Ldh family oxidoreductase [Chloroflexota bacterium]